MHFRITIVLISFLVGGDLHAQSIDWEVVNRFRVFDKETHHNQYIRRIQQLARISTYSPLIDASAPKLRGVLGHEHNFPTKWNESREQYDVRWVHDPVRDVRIETSGIARGSRCVWRQDGAELPGRHCSDRVVKVTIGKPSTVDVEVTTGGRALRSPLTVTLDPKDVLVAVLGDSYASGESNPHLMRVSGEAAGQARYPAIWWDTRCHRSMVSGPVQAAALMAERNRKASVTFVSYACSGAEINDGVRTRYSGRETVSQILGLWEELGHAPPPSDVMSFRTPGGGVKDNKIKLRTQLGQLRDVLCKPNGNCGDDARLRPDILLVAIGGNDIGFGEIGRRLLLSNPRFNSDEEIEKWRNESKTELLPLFDKLDGDFMALASDIRGQINPKRTMLFEYPDPTQFSTAPGSDFFCGRDARQYRRFGAAAADYALIVKRKDAKGISFYKNHGLYNFLLTRDEAEFAQWIVHELNRRIGNAAKRQWNAQGQPAEVLPLQDLKGPDGLRRGVCAPNSWFTGIIESWNRQGWIPVDPDKENSFALKLNSGQCPGQEDNGQCIVKAGNVTSGILHPNFFGHYNVGRVLLLQMEEALRR